MAANPQQQQQQQQQQQPPSHQQTIVRPEDGELLPIVTKLESFLATLTQPATNSKQLFEKLCELSAKAADGKDQHTDVVDAHLQSVLPPAFLTAIRDHFSEDKLRLSDEAALAAKEEGNKLFQNQRFDDAVLSFTKAMLSVKSDDTFAVLLGNRSAAFLSAGMTLASALDTTTALSLQPSSAQLRVKLLDRRARCLAALGFEKESTADSEAGKAIQAVLGGDDGGDDETAKTKAEKDALDVAIPDPSDILNEKQNKVTDSPWIFQDLADLQQGEHQNDKKTADGNNNNNNGVIVSSAIASIHTSLRCSMDQQPLARSATESYRRFSSLNTGKIDPEQNAVAVTTTEQQQQQQKGDDPCDILRELPSACAVRTDALLVVCAQCLQRSSTLYPSEQYRAAGFRCRGMFCTKRCADLFWETNGKTEVGITMYMAASAETVCCLRLMKHFLTSTSSAVSSSTQIAQNRDVVDLRWAASSGGSSSSSSSLAADVGETIFANLSSQQGGKPELLSLPSTASASVSSASSCWLIKENIEANVARSRETEGETLAAFGGHESSLALVGYILKVFPTIQVAKTFLDIYRRVIAFLQHVTFVDRVFLSKASSQVATGDTHTTVPVVAGIAYYPLATTLFNHSCDPNCAVTYKGNPFSCSAQLHVRLLRRVQEGEMLTVSWQNVNKNTNHSTRSRIQVLRKLFGFSCCCSACASSPDEAVSRDKQEMMIKAADYYQKGRRLIRERKDLPDAVAVLKQSLEILFKHVCPAPGPPIFVVAKTFDAIAQASVMMGDSAGCLEYVKKRVAVLEQIQGELSFEFVMELEKLAALLRNLARAGSDESERVQVERRAVRVLRQLYPASVSLQSEIDTLSQPSEVLS